VLPVRFVQDEFGEEMKARDKEYGLAHMTEEVTVGVP